MDGECSDSDLLLKKLQGHDRISELPEEIIVSILSFLSVKEAAATSLLSPQWRNLWKQTPKLIFISEIPNLNSSSNDVQEQDSSWDAERCEYVKTVNSVLRSHKALVLRWFVASFYVNKSAQPHVVKWLELLSSRRVKRLLMDFQCWDEKDMLVLEELLRESRLFEAPRTDHVMLLSLRKLSLEHLKVRGEDIELFLRNCPSLKELIICYAVFTSDVEICSLKLKRLGIYGCSGGISVKVSAPKLNWIVYNDRLKELSLENVPKLAKAHFSIRSTKFALQHFGSAASCCISQLTILSLTLNHPRVNVVNKFVEMPKLKKLTVTYFGVYNQTLLPLTPLLWASPRLEEFVLRFIRTLAEGAIIDEMEVTGNAEKRSHKKLKVFEFRGYCSGISDQIVELVAYISDNCAKFRNIIIDGPIPGTIIVHGDPPHKMSEIEADETESDHRDYLKEQLREKVPNHIHMQFS